MGLWPTPVTTPSVRPHAMPEYPVQEAHVVQHRCLSHPQIEQESPLRALDIHHGSNHAQQPLSFDNWATFYSQPPQNRW